VTIDIDGGHDEVPSNLLEVPDTGKSGIDGETISEGRKKTQDDKEDEAPSQPLVPHTELGAIEKRSPSTRSERRRNSAARKRSKGGGSKKRKRDRTARRK